MKNPPANKDTAVVVMSTTSNILSTKPAAITLKQAPTLEHHLKPAPLTPKQLKKKMAHPTRDDASSPKSSSRAASHSKSPRQSPSRNGGKKSSSRSPNRARRPRSSPTRAASAPTSSSFLKYCQIHGHEVTEEQRHSLPLNRCDEDSLGCSSSTTAVRMDLSSSRHNAAPAAAVGSWESKLSSAADHAANWLDSWKQQPQSEMAYYCQHHPLGPHAKTLRYSQHDILNVAMDDATFQSLKDGLRKRGVVTNNYLKENLHFYVQHMKQVELKREHKRRQGSRSPMRNNSAA